MKTPSPRPVALLRPLAVLLVLAVAPSLLRADDADTAYEKGNAALAKNDNTQAIASYNEALRLNPKLAEAYVNRGLAYENLGDHDRTIADCTEAIRWFQMAAEQSDPYSQSHLGYLYEKGFGAARDEKVAAQWYAKAAEQGNDYGQARLASMYRDGRGVAQDFQQAANWFSKAADQGSTWAQLNLGILYVKGQGVPQDEAKGIGLLRNAADQNDADAQYNLGWAYESGTGVPKDAQEAIKWYGKASNGGHAQANAHLHGLLARESFWGILLRHIGLSSGL